MSGLEIAILPAEPLGPSLSRRVSARITRFLKARWPASGREKAPPGRSGLFSPTWGGAGTRGEVRIRADAAEGPPNGLYVVRFTCVPGREAEWRERGEAWMIELGDHLILGLGARGGYGDQEGRCELLDRGFRLDSVDSASALWLPVGVEAERPGWQRSVLDGTVQRFVRPGWWGVESSS